MRKHETVILNGTEYGFDAKGSLVSIKHQEAGTLLLSNDGGMIDLAFPIGDLEIQRLSSRRCKSAEFIKTEGRLEIYYKDLGLSYPQFVVTGTVDAKVVIEAMDDGKSISIACTIMNNSDNAVKQSAFPDLDGFAAIGGENETYITHCNGRKQPFVEMKTPPTGQRPMTYASKTAAGEVIKMGSSFANSMGRWIEFGDYKRGLSIFSTKWGIDEAKGKSSAVNEVYLKLNNKVHTLRIAFLEELSIASGEVWESEKYILTPHTYGWANGIIAYREWVQKNIKRVVPIPKRVREAIGFRTIWPAMQYPQVKESIIWPYELLPEVARESKEHGIDEIVMWDTLFFTLPFEAENCHPLAGGKEKFLEAIKKCKEIGVYLTPFLSYRSIWKNQAFNYGFKLGDTMDSWTYHTDFIPQFRPKYGTVMSCAYADISNQDWQRDVSKSLYNYREIGLNAISWDQFDMDSGNEKTDGLLSVIAQHRLEAYKNDPEASFSGEECISMELSAGYMDFTWNWGFSLSIDTRPFNNAFNAPRINHNISGDSLAVKYAFIDNNYINIMLTNPDGYEGDAWITEYPEFSKALKLCTARKKQFMTYFLEAMIVGDCVVTKNEPRLRTTGYACDSGIFICLLAIEKEGYHDRLSLDVSVWSTDQFKTLNFYNEDGVLAYSTSFFKKGLLEINIQYCEMAFIEITSIDR